MVAEVPALSPHKHCHRVAEGLLIRLQDYRTRMQGSSFFFFISSRSSRQCHSFQLVRSCELCSRSFISWSVVTDCQTVTNFFVRYSKAGVLVFQWSIDGVVCFFGRLSIALVNDILSIFCICFCRLLNYNEVGLLCIWNLQKQEVPTNWSRKKLPVTRSHEFCAAGIWQIWEYVRDPC